MRTLSLMSKTKYLPNSEFILPGNAKDVSQSMKMANLEASSDWLFCFRGMYGISIEKKSEGEKSANVQRKNSMSKKCLYRIMQSTILTIVIKFKKYKKKRSKARILFPSVVMTPAHKKK